MESKARFKQYSSLRKALVLSCLIHAIALLALSEFSKQRHRQMLPSKSSISTSPTISIRLIQAEAGRQAPASTTQNKAQDIDLTLPSPAAGKQVTPKASVTSSERAVNVRPTPIATKPIVSEEPVRAFEQQAPAQSKIEQAADAPQPLQSSPPISPRKEAPSVTQEAIADSADQTAPVDIKQFARQYGKQLEQHSKSQYGPPIETPEAVAINNWRKSFSKHLSRYGQTWKEYKANDGTSWVRFSGGSCIKLPEFDHREHKHLNKTITLTDCPDS